MKCQAVGIDLGTTFSALSIINPAGKPEIVPNRDGERITASAVFLDRNGSVLVGDTARAAASAEPMRVVTEVKRRMGEPQHRYNVDGKAYSPVDISAIILGRLKADAELILGPISQAVVTVPAYFDEVRRKATMDAASQAGLEVLRIINEPTAAALAYAADGRVRGKVLVYDFGGGTFDVSIVEIASPHEVRVIASEGDHQLGGKDLDRALVQHFSSAFRDRFGVGLDDNAVTEYRTMEEAERAKKRLSSLSTVSGIPLLRGSNSLSVAVTRAEYEVLIQTHLVRTEMLIDDVLSAAGLTPSAIDAVLLVGGTARTPAVQALLQRRFGRAPQMGINPDEAVALGAAIQAGVLLHNTGAMNLPGAAGAALRRTQIIDITPHSFGTISISEAFGEMKERNSIIIPKNHALPVERTETYYTVVDNQTAIQCRVTQGEESDPEFVKIVYEEELQLPPNRPKAREIRITYSYDANGRMACEFLDVESGRSKRCTLDTAQWARGSPARIDMDNIDLDDV